MKNVQTSEWKQSKKAQHKHIYSVYYTRIVCMWRETYDLFHWLTVIKIVFDLKCLENERFICWQPIAYINARTNSMAPCYAQIKAFSQTQIITFCVSHSPVWQADWFHTFYLVGTTHNSPAPYNEFLGSEEPNKGKTISVLSKS